MEILLETAFKSQSIIGGIHFVLFFFSWPFLIGFLKDYHNKTDRHFNCLPKPSDYIKQLCYDSYVSSLSPLLTPLDVAGITYGVLLFFWVSFIITGAWLKLRIGREQDVQSKKRHKRKLLVAFICQVCFRFVVLVIMMGLFCGFQTLSFPSIYRCTPGNITLSSTTRVIVANMSCNDLRYREKSKLNKAIIGIMSISIFLCIVTILHLVVTRKKFFEQLLGNITAPDDETSTALVRQPADANTTQAVEDTVEGTQAEEQPVDVNGAQENEDPVPEESLNDTQAEEEPVDVNGAQEDEDPVPEESVNDTQAEEDPVTEESVNDTQAEVHTKEQLNYFRACHIVSEILPQGLRSIFKQEWDNRYKTTLGEWQDTPKNGLDFFNCESRGNRKRNARVLETMKKGDTAEWDCTMLFYAILYSNSIHGLNQLIHSSVSDLREFRNRYFAHIVGAELSDVLFEPAVRKVESTFQALGLSVAQIQATKRGVFAVSPLVKQYKEEPKEDLIELQNEIQKSSADVRPKIKLNSVEKQFEGQERQIQPELHERSFCVLPPVPPHQIVGREGHVATMANKLDDLRDTNRHRLSYFYISGCPGSGKSQLARLVAKRVYDKTINRTSSPSFVMTLNAENLETLLESFVSLATKVNCPEPKVNSIHSSDAKATEEKINNLKNLVEKKISFYEWWLLVVDNVSSLSDTLGFLPELGNEQWGNGQLLITTQDCSCIPPDSSSFLCCHTSINQGMTPLEASGFLVTISGIEDHAVAVNDVAKAIDYQPLALAQAAFYVAKVRKLDANFGWIGYLEKLKEGKFALTQKVLAKFNQSYPKTTMEAIQSSIEREMNSDVVMRHVFTFLAFCAPQPLRLDILTNYVLSMREDHDEEDIAQHIQDSCFILIDKEKDSVYIRLHQMVHDVVKSTLINDSMNSNEHVRSVHAAVMSFNQLIDKTMPWTWNTLDSVAHTKHFVGHLKTLSTEIGRIFADEELEKSKVLSHYITDISRDSFHLRRLGRITQCNGEYLSAREYFSAAVKVIDRTEILTDRLELARGCTGLGRVTSSLGFHQEGKKHLERAMSIYLTNSETDHVKVESARVYSFLGKVERRLGNLAQAKAHFESSLNVLSKLNLEQDDDAAHTYLHLGSVQCDLGDHQEADTNLQLALSIYSEKFVPRYVDVGRTFHHLGLLQLELANLPQAKEYLEKALSILLEKLGTEHVEVARAYDSMGDVEYKMGENQQAKKHYELALTIFKKKFRPDHEAIKRTTRSLSLCDNSL